jgi:hypothetical protein
MFNPVTVLVLYKGYVAVRMRINLRGESHSSHAHVTVAFHIADILQLVRCLEASVRLLFDGDRFHKGKMVEGFRLVLSTMWE